MMRGRKGPGPTKGGKAKGNDKGKGKDGDSKLPEWKLVPVAVGGAREPRPNSAQPVPPLPNSKPRAPYPYPAVIELVDREQERRERQNRDRAEREDNERGEALKALEEANRQKAAEIEAERSAQASEVYSANMANQADFDRAHAAKVSDIERHYGEVQSENSRLDYFANREAIERQQQEAGDRTPDRQQDNGGWDRDR